MNANVVMITGSSSGFGRAAALEFLQAGWNVVATMRDVSRWSGEHRTEHLLVLPLDVEDPLSIEVAVSAAVEHFGHIDCLVNNAGRGLFSVFGSTPMAAIRSLFETNLFGLMQVTQAVLPHFQQHGQGRVINVSSGSGIVPSPLMSVYSATKHAVEGLTESLAYELATQNVTVKLIEPGFVQGTNFVQQTMQSSSVAPVPASYQAFVDQTQAMYMQPSPAAFSTETDVARAIVAAASDTSDQLRSVVGADTEMFAHMRRETSETEYIAWVHALFAAKVPTVVLP